MKQINQPIVNDILKEKVQLEMTLGELAVLFGWLGKSSQATLIEYLEDKPSYKEVVAKLRSNTINDHVLYQDMKQILIKNGVKL